MTMYYGHEGAPLLHYPLGAIPEAEWCSPANPQGDCKPYAGICKPMTFDSLALFKDLQNQINRIASIAGWSKIRIDGSVGPKTTAAAAKAIQFIGGFSPGAGCDAVARSADKIAADLKRGADAKGAPAVVKGPPAPKRGPSPAPGVPGPLPKEAGFTAMLTSPLGLVALAIGGLLIWQASKKKPKRKRARRRKATYKKKTITTWL
jgi:hypothetical protein